MSSNISMSSPKISNFGEWKDEGNHLNRTQFVKYATDPNFGRVYLVVAVIDLENDKELPPRLQGKKGYLVDAEFLPWQNPDEFVWHHEKRFPERESAHQYAKKVMSFVDRQSLDQLSHEPKTGSLNLSRLEGRLPKMEEVFHVA